MTTFIDGISGAVLRDGVVRPHLYTHHAQYGAGIKGARAAQASRCETPAA